VWTGSKPKDGDGGWSEPGTLESHRLRRATQHGERLWDTRDGLLGHRGARSPEKKLRASEKATVTELVALSKRVECDEPPVVEALLVGDAFGLAPKV
jgi:hypothetical protein